MYYHYGKWDPMFRGCPLLGGDKCTITYYHYGKWDPMFRGCPLLGGDKCTITMGSGIPCSEVVLFLEVTNVLSLWEVGSYVQRLSSSWR